MHLGVVAMRSAVDRAPVHVGEPRDRLEVLHAERDALEGPAPRRARCAPPRRARRPGSASRSRSAVKALSVGCVSAMRASTACISSTGDARRAAQRARPGRGERRASRSSFMGGRLRRRTAGHHERRSSCATRHRSVVTRRAPSDARRAGALRAPSVRSPDTHRASAGSYRSRGREDRALDRSVPAEDRRDHQPSAPHAPVSRGRRATSACVFAPDTARARSYGATRVVRIPSLPFPQLPGRARRAARPARSPRRSPRSGRTSCTRSGPPCSA